MQVRRVPERLARRSAWLLVLVALLAGASGAVPPKGAQPGGYLWTPQIAPHGPMVLVVSLPKQEIHVYRNGVRIGVSPVSSGKAGHETPVGVFTILQKHVEHASNLYDDAPMPFMQRLTWSGVALHAGRLPGRPASHGCIRLPPAFAKVLFAETRRGDVVVVTGRSDAPGMATGAEWLKAEAGGFAVAETSDSWWQPALSPTGPITVVVSTADARIAVTRNGRLVGSAPVHVEPGLTVGTRAYVLLDGSPGQKTSGATAATPRRWMEVALGPPVVDDHVVADAFRSGQLAVPAAFAREVDLFLQPGATVIVTDEPLGSTQANEPLFLEPAAAADRP